MWDKGITLFMWYPVMPSSFIERIILSLINCLDTPTKSQLTKDAWVYFWTLNSVPLLYVCSYSRSHRINNCSSVVSFEIRKCKFPPTLLFFNISLAIWLLCASIWILALVSQFLQKNWNLDLEYVVPVGQFGDLNVSLPTNICRMSSNF